MKSPDKFLFLLIILSIIRFEYANGQNLTAGQSEFLTQNSKIIYTDSINSNGNWQPILEAIGHKKMVLLGEFTHGAREPFLSRNDLIKELHEQKGFNVILFESGIGEMANVDLNLKKLNSNQLVSGFFWGWRVPEMAELMDFAQSEKMCVGGFDVQRTGGGFRFLLKEVAQKEHLDTTLYVDLEKRFVQTSRKLSNRKTKYDSVETETRQVIKDLQTLHDILNQKNPSKKRKYVLRTLTNRIAYLKYRLQFLKDNDWNQRWLARDSMMAANVEWLSENIFKNEKLIIVAHNFHISKFNENETVMGEYLKETFGSEMYALGVFGGKGTYHNNSGIPKEMLSPDSTRLDIKHIIEKSDGFTTFLDIPKSQNSHNNWIFEPIVVNNSFIDLSGSKQLILAKCFDGILLIDEVSPPKGRME